MGFTDVLNSNEENAYYRVLAYKDGLKVGKSAIIEILVSKDTDNDGLLDGKEVELGTDPLNSDSNGNGILDGDEIFNVEKSPEGEEVDANVTPTISIPLKASQVDTFEMKKIAEDDIFLSRDIPGYISSSYDYSSLLQRAIDSNIIIYTIGLGSSLDINRSNNKYEVFKFL